MKMKDFGMPNVPHNVIVHGKPYHRVGPLIGDGTDSPMIGAANWYIYDINERGARATKLGLDPYSYSTIK